MTATDYSEMLNANPDGWCKANGLRFVRATADEVVAELEIQPIHLQAFGLVHGGVHCGIIETIASVATALNVMPSGRTAVGVENHTSFIRAVRSGLLRATALPLTRGRHSQAWEVSIVDEQGRLAATGRVRMICLDGEVAVAGEKLELKAS